MFACPIKQRQLSLHENCLPSTREAAEISIEIDQKNQELDHLTDEGEHVADLAGSIINTFKILELKNEIKNLQSKFNALSF